MMTHSAKPIGGLRLDNYGVMPANTIKPEWQDLNDKT